MVKELPVLLLCGWIWWLIWSNPVFGLAIGMMLLYGGLAGGVWWLLQRTVYTPDEAFAVVGLFFFWIPVMSGLMLIWLPLDAVIVGASASGVGLVMMLIVRAVFGVGPTLFWPGRQPPPLFRRKRY